MPLKYEMVALLHIWDGQRHMVSYMVHYNKIQDIHIWVCVCIFLQAKLLIKYHVDFNKNK